MTRKHLTASQISTLTFSSLIDLLLTSYPLTNKTSVTLQYKYVLTKSRLLDSTSWYYLPCALVIKGVLTNCHSMVLRNIFKREKKKMFCTLNMLKMVLVGIRTFVSCLVKFSENNLCILCHKKKKKQSDLLLLNKLDF